ncbi:MAG TPA: hypothetical protein VF658_02115 [Pyrinomonadaceae bacterium]
MSMVFAGQRAALARVSSAIYGRSIEFAGGRLDSGGNRARFVCRAKADSGAKMLPVVLR